MESYAYPCVSHCSYRLGLYRLRFSVLLNGLLCFGQWTLNNAYACISPCFPILVFVFLSVFIECCVCSCYSQCFIDSCACASVYQCLYELLCMRLHFSVFYLLWTLVLAHVFLGVCMDSCACTCVSQCFMDSCACACVSQCLYGLLHVHALAFLSVLLTLVLTHVFLSVLWTSCACASQCLYGLLCIRLRFSVFVRILVLTLSFLISVC